ncbi:ribonuclease III [Madurella fahalii]|uniref:Ribonuclease III n=1 Tax=Madurella fahalii TaxID=1157608 RepID=A0ABQ0G5J5_9PEZI
MSKRAHSQSAVVEAEPAPKRPKAEATSAEPKPPQFSPVTSISKWTSSSIAESFPPLPEVLDPAMETAALTHSGMRKNPWDPSYERLEWIGDAYLELIASELIFNTFTTLEEGRCSQYREMLIRNSTLGKFSIHYGLDKRANFPAEFGLGGRPNGTKATEKQRAKALGDIFEAYVGAVVRSDPENGFNRASEWLKALWGPVLERQILEQERNAGNVKDKEISAKTRLEQMVCVPGVKLEYRDLPSNGKKDRDTKQQLYFVGCFLHGWGETGLQLGYGNALGKKEAGQKAAQMALDNKKLIKKYVDKKKAFMAARAAQAPADTQT